MRILTATVATGLLAVATGTLGACGATGHAAASNHYCTQLKTDKAYFQSLDSDNPDLTQIDQLFGRIHTLKAAAPGDVVADWRTIDDAFTTMQDAFDEAGLDGADLAALQKGDVPADIDLEKLAALQPKLEHLIGKDVNDAADRIAENAKDRCGFSLTDS